MKLRDQVSEILFEELLQGAGDPEREAFEEALEVLVQAGTLDQGQANNLENRAGLLATMMAEHAFMAGLECGRDLRRLCCQ